LLACCDNTTKALAGMLGNGGAGPDTTAVPPKHRRLMVTCDRRSQPRTHHPAG